MVKLDVAVMRTTVNVLISTMVTAAVLARGSRATPLTPPIMVAGAAAPLLVPAIALASFGRLPLATAMRLLLATPRAKSGPMKSKQLAGIRALPMAHALVFRWAKPTMLDVPAENLAVPDLLAANAYRPESAPYMHYRPRSLPRSPNPVFRTIPPLLVVSTPPRPMLQAGIGALLAFGPGAGMLGGIMPGS